MALQVHARDNNFRKKMLLQWKLVLPASRQGSHLYCHPQQVLWNGKAEASSSTKKDHSYEEVAIQLPRTQELQSFGKPKSACSARTALEEQMEATLVSSSSGWANALCSRIIVEFCGVGPWSKQPYTYLDESSHAPIFSPVLFNECMTSSITLQHHA